jgi:hypothetical protein
MFVCGYQCELKTTGNYGGLLDLSEDDDKSIDELVNRGSISTKFINRAHVAGQIESHM